MPPRSRTKKPKPRSSGPTQREADRANPQTLLRLRPEVRAAIVDAAARAGTSLSTIVELAWSIAVDDGRIEKAIEIATRGPAAKDAAAEFFR